MQPHGKSKQTMINKCITGGYFKCITYSKSIFKGHRQSCWNMDYAAALSPSVWRALSCTNSKRKGSVPGKPTPINNAAFMNYTGISICSHLSLVGSSVFHAQMKHLHRDNFAWLVSTSFIPVSL